VSGMYKGNHTTPKWKLLEKWWPHPSQAINYIIQQEIGREKCTKDIEEFKLWLNEQLDKMKKEFDNQSDVK